MIAQQSNRSECNKSDRDIILHSIAQYQTDKQKHSISYLRIQKIFIVL